MPWKEVMAMTQAEWFIKAMEMAFQEGKGLWAHSLLDVLKGLTAEQAAWKPQGQVTRSIWEIVNHVIFWKEIALRHFKGEEAIKVEDDWPAVSEVGEEAWSKAVERLKEVHADLIERLKGEELDPDRTIMLVEGWTAPLGETLYGLIAHDCYHIGQILTLRQLQGIGL